MDSNPWHFKPNPDLDQNITITGELPKQTTHFNEIRLRDVLTQNEILSTRRIVEEAEKANPNNRNKQIKFITEYVTSGRLRKIIETGRVIRDANGNTEYLQPREEVERIVAAKIVKYNKIINVILERLYSTKYSDSNLEIALVYENLGSIAAETLEKKFPEIKSILLAEFDKRLSLPITILLGIVRLNSNEISAIKDRDSHISGLRYNPQNKKFVFGNLMHDSKGGLGSVRPKQINAAIATLRLQIQEENPNLF